MYTNNNNKFQNESFNNQMNQTEKVHYLGDLRIIGQVVNKLEDKEPIGYVIMTEKTQKFKMYTVSQTISLLQKFKFVNAALENGRVVNTECAMTRLPKFNTKMTVIGNTGILILGEIRDGNTKIGYRAMDTNAKIIDINEDELLKLASTGIKLLNAKIVNKGSKEVVSGIKQEFTKIEKSKLAQLNVNNKKERKEQVWIKHKHTDKWFNDILPNILVKAFTNRGNLLTDKAYARERNDSSIKYLDVYRETKIILKEIYTDKYGIKLTDEDKDLLKKITKLRHKDCIRSGDYANASNKSEYMKLIADTDLYFILLAQFVLNNKDTKEKVEYKCINYLRRLVVTSSKVNDIKESLNKLKNTGLLSRNSNHIVCALLNAIEIRIDTVQKIVRSSIYTKFTTTTFTTAEDMAQLGFTISEANRDYEYKTKTNNNKTLLYLGDIIYDDYEKLKGMSRCLGDLASIAYIEKLISKYGDLKDSEGYAEHYNMKKSDIRAVIEIIIAIAYMFNSLPMKNYVEHIKSKELDELGIQIDYDEIANTDYKLPKEIVMYYSSGFNVFLNDNKYLPAFRQYKKEHLVNAELINYRQLGIKHNILHPLLQDELASIVNMVTSNECDTKTIERLIGQLRYL